MNSQEPPQPWSKRLLNFVIRHPITMILLFCAITLVFAFHLPDLQFRTSIYDLAVKDLPETQYYEEFKSIFGSEEVVLVVARTDGVFKPKTFAQLEVLSDKLGNISGIRRIVSLPSIKKDMELSGNRSAAEFSRIAESISLFDKNFLSSDKKTTVLSAVLTESADRNTIVEQIDAILKAQQTQAHLYQIGMPVVARALAEYTEQDFLALPPITFAVMLVVLYLLFGNLSGILIPAGSVLLALVWTLGLMAWTETGLSLMTMIVPVFLIAVGTAYCMHVTTAFQRASRSAKDRHEAIIVCYSRVSLPSALAVATTIVGLASLLVNKIEGIREFALFSCFGMVGILAVMLGLLPAVFKLMPQQDAHKRAPSVFRKKIGTVLERIIILNLRYQNIVLGALTTVVVLAVWGTFMVHVETNPVDYFKKNTRISRNFFDIYTDMAGSFPVNVVLDSQTDSYFEDPDNLVKLARTEAFLQTIDGVDKTVSFTDLLKLVNYASNRYQPEFYALPEEDFEVRILANSVVSILGNEMFTRFMKSDMSCANIMLRTHISSSRDFLRVRKSVEEYLSENHARDFVFHVTGLGMVISESSHLLTSSQIKSLSISLVLIFGIMLLLFLSGRVGIIAIITNMFPILVNFGIMGWLGIKLSVVTSLIAGIAIGLAVDDTIHYLFTYNREFRKDLDKDRALTETIRRVGVPVVFTTITISLGFFVLVFSHFQPTAVFGLLMVATMLSALIGDLLILPSLMMHVELVTAWDLFRLLPSVGGLTPDVARQLHQPLNAIKMRSRHLRSMLENGRMLSDEQVRRFAAEIGTEAERAATFLDRLSKMGSREDLAKENVDVNKCIADTIVLLSHQMVTHDIHINLDLEDGLPLILAHPGRLGQVFYNLVLNAAEAIEKNENKKDARQISIKTGTRNGFVVITVNDTGVGIPAHMLDRIMEPFFTTKESGKGKGLGLSICKEIVQDFKGHLRFWSRPDEGATFRLSFPVSDR